MPVTDADYALLARKILRAPGGAPQLQRVSQALKEVTRPEHLDAIKKALATYRKALARGEDINQAASLAGKELNRLLKGAGPGEGGDFVYGKLITELKSNWTMSFTELSISKANEQVLGYVLKDFIERGDLRRGFVWHVFINPKNGKAVSVVVDSLDGRSLAKMLDSVP
jgi:hypothetical protein